MAIYLIGAGGHAKCCISCIESAGMEIGGLIDHVDRIGDLVAGHPVITSDASMHQLVKDGALFLIAIGQIDSPDLRMKMAGILEQAGGEWATVIAHGAHVDRTASIGAGSIIMHRAVVNASASLGRHTIANTAAIIEHDSAIADFVHVSTGAIVNGDCKIGTGSFIGSGAIIRQGVIIGERVIIGAGAVVIRDITEAGTWAGIPARRIR